MALKGEFDRLHSMNVKLSPSFLACAAKSLIQTADPDASFNHTTLVRGAPIAERITVRWVQTFMAAHDLIIRRQAGNHSVSPEKQLFIEKNVAYHLGTLKRGFEAGDLVEDLVENADETHFFV